MGQKYSGVPMLFRIFLFFGFIIIAFIFIYYTQHVVDKLKDNSLRMVNLSIKLLQMELSNETSGEATGLIFDEIIAPTEIPIIITDRDNDPLFFRNIPGMKSDIVTARNRPRLKRMVDDMYHINGRFPIVHVNRETGEETTINYFYYGDPLLISQLQAMPVIEIGIVTIFLVVGYIGYRNIKRSEQNYIWVGMAKETAHQLGTPISSLLGWLEIMRINHKEGEPNPGAQAPPQSAEEITEHMSMDIERLQKIANRFSQIGSRPDLKNADLNKIIMDTVDYFRERLPYQGKGIAINFVPGKICPVDINAELIGWVVENLIKNSLEACDPMKGRIMIATTMSSDGKFVIAEFGDNGKGIPPKNQKRIFQPGFTSKKRGWGLGLSLAKRIVREYHGGRISLKSSTPGRETIMQVALPAKCDSPNEESGQS